MRDIRSGSRARVVVFVANWLSTEAEGGSVLSHLERALLACPEVEELYDLVPTRSRVRIVR